MGQLAPQLAGKGVGGLEAGAFRKAFHLIEEVGTEVTEKGAESFGPPAELCTGKAKRARKILEVTVDEVAGLASVFAAQLAVGTR
jgi:hypothetical protein